MSVLKNIGYVLAAILVLAVLVLGGALIAAVTAFIGFVLFCIAVVGFIAYLIKDYCETKRSS